MTRAHKNEPTYDERVRACVDEITGDALGKKLVKHFPELTTGDTTPDREAQLRSTLEKYVRQWVLGNYHAVSLTRIAKILTEKGLPSRVEQTGGGTATVYVGEYDKDGRAKACLGPGWFDERGAWGQLDPEGNLNYGPDDDGEGKSIYITEPWGEEQIAIAVCKFVHNLKSS